MCLAGNTWEGDLEVVRWLMMLDFVIEPYAAADEA